MEHGADSYLAGVVIAGVHRRNLRICGCGKWEAASPEARKVSVERMEEYARRIEESSGQSESVDEPPPSTPIPGTGIVDSGGREVE